jgi:hypothetical protein
MLSILFIAIYMCVHNDFIQALLTQSAYTEFFLPNITLHTVDLVSCQISLSKYLKYSLSLSPKIIFFPNNNFVIKLVEV